MREPRTIPGGLRMQMVLGLCLLLFIAFVVKGEAVERAVGRLLFQEKQDDALSIADVMTEGEWSIRDVEVVAATHGAHAILLESGGQSLRFGQIDHAPPRAGTAPVTVVENDETYVVVRRVGTNDVTVVLPADVPADDIVGAVRLLRSFFASEALLILVFAYAFLTFLVMRPLRAIGVATERASDGDLASPISTLPANEFGAVGQDFNAMLTRLEEQRNELEARLVELRQANEEIRRTQDELIRSEKLASVGQLAAGIAHEVGNPLAAIAGYNELLQDGGLDDDDVADILRRTGAQLERIQTIIRGLLDYSRDDAGKHEPSPVSLQPVAEDALKLVEALPRARGVVFANDIPDELAAYAVPTRLSQVLVNLLVNAVDAMQGRDDASVRLRAERVADHVLLHVADSGPGIPAEQLSRIFDPFFTTKEPGRGTGLGLAISQRIVEDMGGRLTVESGDGGATFTIRLRGKNA